MLYCVIWIAQDKESETMKADRSYFLEHCCHTEEQRDAVKRLIKTRLGEVADETSRDCSNPEDDPDNCFNDVLYRVSYEVEIDLQSGYEECRERYYTNRELKNASSWVRKYRNLGTEKAIICELY